MSDILSEIDNALFQERMEQIWRKYGKLIIAGLVGIVLLTAAISAYTGWKDSNARENTGAIISALDRENAAATLQDFARDKDGVHAALAKLNAAYLLSQEGKVRESLELYRQVSQLSGVPEVFGDYATLSGLYLNLDTLAKNPDEAQSALDQATTLMNKDESPWRYHARIAVAMIQGDLKSNPAEAVNTLKPILAENVQVPESLRKRARSISQIFALEQGANVESSNKTDNPDG